MIWWLRWEWIKYRRRSLEARLFCMGALGPWERVKEENRILGVWRRDK